MAQRNNIYQALIHRQYFLLDTFIVGFGPFMGFDDNKKNIEYHQHLTYNMELIKNRSYHKDNF